MRLLLICILCLLCGCRTLFETRAQQSARLLRRKAETEMQRTPPQTETLLNCLLAFHTIGQDLETQKSLVVCILNQYEILLTEKRLSEVELQLQELVEILSSSKEFAAYSARLAELVQRAGQLRMEKNRTSILSGSPLDARRNLPSALAESRKFRILYDYLPNLSRRIRESLLADYCQTVEPFVNKAIVLAQEAQSNQQYGLCLSFCTFVQHLCQVDELELNSPALLQAHRSAVNLGSQAKEVLQREVLPQSVLLQDIKSETPGIGPVFRRDLQAALADAIIMYGCAPFVFLPKETHRGTALGYIVTKGRLGTFLLAADKMLPLAPMTTYRSGKYNPQTQTQEILALPIHRQSRVRTVHCPLQMTIVGPEGEQEIAPPQDYSHSFVTELTYPQEELPISTVHLATPREPSPLPQLLRERVWTDGEMMDEARKETIRQTVEQMLIPIQHFPIFLYEKALRLMKTDGFAAAELLGQSLLICKYITPDRAIQMIPPEKIVLKQHFHALLHLKNNLQETIFPLILSILPQ